MTWGEFKRLVNEEVEDDERIIIIDVSYPPSGGELIIEKDLNGASVYGPWGS